MFNQAAPWYFLHPESADARLFWVYPAHPAETPPMVPFPRLLHREQLGVQYPVQGCFGMQTGTARNPTINPLTSREQLGVQYPAQGCFGTQTGTARNPTINPLTSREQLGVQYPAQGCFVMETGTARNPTINPLTSSAIVSNTTSKQEKCYKPQDKRFKFVDRDDDLDFLCEGFKSPRALMSCGHAVTPTSLTNWCLRLLEQGKFRFTCGVCDAEWRFTEVRKMALLTPREVRNFKKTLDFNAARQMRTTKLCPGCSSPVQRESGSDLNVLCRVCTAQKGRAYEFCWQCLREWKGARPRKDRCENPDCCDHSLKTLETCPETTLNSVVCPSIRACPTCGLLVEHTNKFCKSVVCPRCNEEFCFVCLKRMCGLCSSVAPRQTSIPVWQRK